MPPHKASKIPLAATVQEAWCHKRGSTRSHLDLASLAAKYGDREALRSVITSSSHPFYQRDKHRVLTELVDRPTQDYLPLWCSQNFDLLIYDPETQTYRTKAQTRN